MSKPVSRSLPKPRGVRTPQDARQALRDAGITVTAWAEAHGLNRLVVYQVLRGRGGHWGEAHRAAVLLGIKHGAVGVAPEQVLADKTPKQRATRGRKAVAA